MNRKIFSNKNTQTRYLDDFEKGLLQGEESAYRDMIDIITNQPTAHDVDKVVPDKVIAAAFQWFMEKMGDNEEYSISIKEFELAMRRKNNE